MGDNNDHGAPGRSLLAEMTTLRSDMEALRKAMLELVELQRDLHKKFDILAKTPITDGLASEFNNSTEVQCGQEN